MSTTFVPFDSSLCLKSTLCKRKRKRERKRIGEKRMENQLNYFRRFSIQITICPNFKCMLWQTERAKTQQKICMHSAIFFYEGVIKWMFYVPPVAILLVKIEKKTSRTTCIKTCYSKITIPGIHLEESKKKCTKKRGEENKFMYFLHSFFFSLIW